jgi:glycosyltransferase involved in cell wall biosynthesis
MSVFWAIMKLVFWASLGLIAYVYIGYPALVDLVSRLRKASGDPCPAPPESPSVTVIIPAHNEEGWIGRKIENTLALHYPSHRLEVIVASDGCTDRTVDITRGYADRGVKVNHRAERSGKMATLNRVVPKARGDIILITDCHATLGSDALQALVRRFDDPNVGCVTGERVCSSTESSASEGEGLYWRYEAWIKRSESRLYSCLGGNGQVLAVRRCLVPPMPGPSDDFYIPMQILISSGKQTVYEPQAKARIPAAATLGGELQRKVRTHVHTLRSLYDLRDGLKPWKSSIWWQFWSHKVLRLFVPYALLAVLFSSAFVWNEGITYRVITSAQWVFYIAVGLGCALARWGFRPRIVYTPFYFVFANVGVLLAWIRWARGERHSLWQRTVRTMPS